MMLKDRDLLQQEVQDCMEAGYRGIDSNENSTTENTDYSNEDENGMVKRLIILKMKNNQKASLNIRV
ncbi:MAG: hypothetical protein WA460_00915 [Nitrososphaeraceae archaeon]